MKEPAGASPHEVVVEIDSCLSNSNKVTPSEHMLEVSRKGTCRRHSKLLVKRKKSRLEDTVWEYKRLDKVSSKDKDEDWFIHEEIVEESISMKLNLWTVLQLVSLMLILMALACTFSISKLKKLTLWDLPLWKWEIFLSVIISGHLLCGWGVRVVVFCIERGFLQKLRVLYLVYGLKKALQIFKKVAKGSESNGLEDLKCFVAQEKALKSIDLFEGIEEEACIDQQSFINWMVEAFKERRYILLSLNDAKTAVEELHLMNVLVSLLILILWLFLFEIQIGHLLVLVSSQLLVIGFIFGNTCRTVFEAIMFLFIMHPFDVGDRCEVDGVQMGVQQVNILTTVFERYDFQKVTYPNYVLATKAIGNYNRSDDMVDQIEFSMHISTPWDKIVTMKEKIRGI